MNHPATTTQTLTVEMERFRGGEQDLLADVLDGPLLGVHQRGYMLGELVAGGQHELPRVRLPVSLHGDAVSVEGT